MLERKDSLGYLKNLKHVDINIFTINIESDSASIDPYILKEQAETLGIKAMHFTHLEDALTAIGNNTETAVIIIAGSLYLCGEALKKNDTYLS